MAESTPQSPAETEFLGRVVARLRGVLGDLLAESSAAGDDGKLRALIASYDPGKMLRSRLAWHLHGDSTAAADLLRGCVAVELIHAATLFHDDVIDGASMRRGQPTAWRHLGQTGAILLGDLCYTCALHELLAGERLDLARVFVAKVRECCIWEIRHEISFRDRQANDDTAIRLARGKTGALFAFAGYLAGSDAAQRAAFEEAAYLVGTAYQLGDDLLDETGDEAQVGKTLRTDRQRGKFTLAQRADDGAAAIRRHIATLAKQAHTLVAPWPGPATRFERYTRDTLLSQFAASTAPVA